MGRFECRWEVADKTVKYCFSIPFNAEAKLILLNLNKSEVISASFGFKKEKNDVVAELTHGEYEIVYKDKLIYNNSPNKFL